MLPDVIEVQTGPNPTGAIIWMLFATMYPDQTKKVVALDNDADEIERAKSRLAALKGAK